MTVRAVTRSNAEATLAKQFETQSELAPSPPRAAAFRRFAEKGLPTRRVESWHYTDLRATMTDAAPLAPAPDPAAIAAARAVLAGRNRIGIARLVTLNGRFVAELSDALPAGAAVARRETHGSGVQDPMVALVEAMSLGGFAVEVARDAELAGPIEIVHVASGEGAYSFYSWLEIALGAGGRASVFEQFIGAGPAAQRHAATTLTLAAGARLKHAVSVEDEAELHLESQIVDLAENAELNGFAMVAGGALTRRQIFGRLTGKQAKIALGGLALLDGSRRADTTLQVVHSAPAGTSREFFRAIVDDEAAGTFQGKVIVANGVQKSDGAMKSQAVLLSPKAQMNAKPELEIFADDVICGHGATVGSLDPEQIFYMRARGVPKNEAEAMLLEAFGQEAIDRVEDETLAEALGGPLRAWLAGRCDGGAAKMEARA